MLELPHTLVGAALAAKIPSPLVSLPLSFLSHFLIDLIPHWNPRLYSETKKFGKPRRKSNIIVIIDVVLSLSFGFFIASRFLPDIKKAIIIIAACFLAVIPDVIEGFWFYLGYRKPWLGKIIVFQHNHQGRASIIPGVLTQMVVILLSFYFSLSK